MAREAVCSSTSLSQWRAATVCKEGRACFHWPRTGPVSIISAREQFKEGRRVGGGGVGRREPHLPACHFSKVCARARAKTCRASREAAVACVCFTKLLIHVRFGCIKEDKTDSKLLWGKNTLLSLVFTKTS